MANGKNGRKQHPVRTIVIIVLLILSSVLGLEITGPWPDIVDYDLPTEAPTATVAVTPEATVKPAPEVPITQDGELLLTMIECGQADSFLFEQSGMVALVDCGTRFTGDDVVAYLKQKGITRIDYVFCTHAHDDHQGGLTYIINNFEIGKVIMPEVEAGKVTANWYISVMQELKDGKYTVEHPKVGDIYKLGDATITIHGPITPTSNELNNYSTVMMVSFGQMDVLMTGDAETEVEKELLAAGTNLDAEILKVGHHGSDTSSSDEFLDAVSPDYALISCKLGNKHDHPIESTMDKFEARGIEVYRTDESGTVVVRITSTEATFDTEPDSYLSGIELEKKVTE